MPNSHASQFSAESFPGSAPFFCKGDYRKIWTHRPIAVRPARDEMALQSGGLSNKPNASASPPSGRIRPSAHLNLIISRYEIAFLSKIYHIRLFLVTILISFPNYDKINDRIHFIERNHAQGGPPHCHRRVRGSTPGREFCGSRCRSHRGPSWSPPAHG
ncbi:hypothetical protein THICB1_90003 [Thiomonas arsenitoxydans]|uniref:Uncharacterized protein n=1 Tax=Thiomonas arsenitoxydans (strain DSM 22701 / CIP 110005 / 3As) TaxID=426114 RepID=A0ABP1Z778_THIA3|nr:hypothetical protein THICB6_100012 [Thiomonas arsenitoxydans]CQR31629.1 hypothetical protein ACO7_250004 [Thiomonas arsenitoxydans]CQR31648.1 hypothetical protein ACO3_270005 [Thiomonas arsenitoxydans]CQR39248.1 hypothetical protein THICB1_90003 [Thiomonas arsenitoxydans]